MIAPHTPSPALIVFSRHALDRLEEREISPILAERIIDKPFVTGTSAGAHYSAGTVTDGRRRLWLTVIHTEPTTPEGTVDVVTVYVGVTASHRHVRELRRDTRAKREGVKS